MRRPGNGDQVLELYEPPAPGWPWITHPPVAARDRPPGRGSSRRLHLGCRVDRGRGPRADRTGLRRGHDARRPLPPAAGRHSMRGEASTGPPSFSARSAFEPVHRNLAAPRMIPTLGLPRIVGSCSFAWLRRQEPRGASGDRGLPVRSIGLDELEPIDLAFGLAAAPGLPQSRPDGRDVRVQSRRERRDGRCITGPGLPDPDVDIRSGVLIIGDDLAPPGGAHECGKAAARSVTIRAVSSCSTRFTTAASPSSKAEVGCTSSHASCRAGGNGASIPGRCEHWPSRNGLAA